MRDTTDQNFILCRHIHVTDMELLISIQKEPGSSSCITDAENLEPFPF
jgi:hypothetical protein